MKIVLEIKDEYISSLKYVMLWLAIIAWIAYVYFFEWWNSNLYLLLASIFAIYMAINLWANDVANNMGPAVWAKALTLGGAIVIAMIFEAAWALIAGSDVVDTIKGWIINWDMIDKSSMEFIAIMLATLLWSALWVNIATFFKAPVSITHSIFWGLIWAWITSSWLSIVNWAMVWKVATAWVIAILLWAFFAIILFVSIKKTILKQDEKWEAAKHWVPVYVALMTWIFSLYLIMKWFKNVLSNSYGSHFDFLLNKIILENWSTKIVIDSSTAIFISIILSVLVYVWLIVHFKKHKNSFFKDKTKFVNKLFNVPLIFAVALLSFAHWSNDVANAIWPLAAIYEATKEGGWELLSNWKSIVPFWIMLLGALSLSFWLAVFWGRLIKTVWKQITKIDQIKAYCIALSAAITVILASAIWMPVSTTQIALWWVFGIGLYREFLKRQKWKDKVLVEKDKMKTILYSWIWTLPAAWVIASIIYWIIMYLS